MYNAQKLNDIVERAKRGELSSDRVIRRALSDSLIDPKDVNNCRALENIRYIDMQTITELTPTAKGYAFDACQCRQRHTHTHTYTCVCVCVRSLAHTLHVARSGCAIWPTRWTARILAAIPRCPPRSEKRAIARTWCSRVSMIRWRASKTRAVHEAPPRFLFILALQPSLSFTLSLPSLFPRRVVPRVEELRLDTAALVSCHTRTDQRQCDGRAF